MLHLYATSLRVLLKFSTTHQSKWWWCCYSVPSQIRLFATHGLQYARLPCPSPSPRVYSNSCPLSQWCHPTISSRHLLLLPSIFPSIGIFSNESVLCIRWPKYWSFIFSTSSSSEYSWFIFFRTDWFKLLAVQEGLKESSPAPKFKSISSSALSFLYGPTLTSIHDYWKNHSFDYMDLCQQSNVSAF